MKREERTAALFLGLFIVVVLISFVSAGSPNAKASNWRPVVLMHGLLASAEAMSHAQGWIEQDFPGIYTHNVEIGNGRDDSLFMDLNDQVASFAATVAADPKLKNGFNLVCHSQGGLICRAYIERYNYPPVYNFISWAGPHGGQYGVPDFNVLCPDYYCPWLNSIMDSILDGSWMNAYFQESISFAMYWKDPLAYSDYLQYNLFLADINNERTQKNATYKAQMTSLNTLCLYYSTTDNIVIPNSSPWFQSYTPGQDVTVTPLRQSSQYLGDWLGLKTLDTSNRLQLVAIPCGHQDIPRDVCKQYYDQYTRPLLNNTLSAYL